MVKPLPSLARIQELLNYDEPTGVFSLRNTDDTRTKLAVSKNRVTITIDGINYRGSRIAWKLSTGVDPSGVIDHVDGNTLNDRKSNLRDVTNAENSRNREIPINNTSGYMGVLCIKETTRFSVSIKVDGRTKHLGTFKDIESAINARKAAEKNYGYHENHGRQKPGTQLKLHPDAKAIDRLGGTNKVASICHVRPPSVSAWRIYGIPEARLMYLKVAYPQAFVEPEPATTPETPDA